MSESRALFPVRHWFLQPSLLILWIVAECLAITSLVLIIYWTREYYDGFAWDGSGKEFNFHPVFMTFGLVIVYGNCKRNFSEAAVCRCFTKQEFLKLAQNLQENVCAGVSFETCNFIKKENLGEMFSCEFCEIFSNPFFTEHLRTTAS